MKKLSKDAPMRNSRRPDLAQLLRKQLNAFEKKFGRPPCPNDPIFFDPDADEPRRISSNNFSKPLLVAMRDAGMPEQMIHASKKTGRLLFEQHKSGYPPHIVAEWDAAVAEYFAVGGNARKSDALPANDNRSMVPPTEIPALKSMPLSADEQKLLFACMSAVDEHLGKEAATVRMRGELAAAILTMAATSAHDSGAAQGHPEQSEARYAAFVDLVVMRARELFDRHR